MQEPSEVVRAGVERVTHERRSGRERIFECNTEAEVRRTLESILESYAGASRSTRKKLAKCAEARIRDLQRQVRG